MTGAYTPGCHSVQFTGGEPTLNRDLPAPIRAAPKWDSSSLKSSPKSDKTRCGVAAVLRRDKGVRVWTLLPAQRPRLNPGRLKLLVVLATALQSKSLIVVSMVIRVAVITPMMWAVVIPNGLVARSVNVPL